MPGADPRPPRDEVEEEIQLLEGRLASLRLLQHQRRGSHASRAPLAASGAPTGIGSADPWEVVSQGGELDGDDATAPLLGRAATSATAAPGQSGPRDLGSDFPEELEDVGTRYYAVWATGAGAPGRRWAGVHAGRGTTAYEGLLDLAGGFEPLRWRRGSSLADARALFAEGCRSSVHRCLLPQADRPCHYWWT